MFFNTQARWFAASSIKAATAAASSINTASFSSAGTITRPLFPSPSLVPRNVPWSEAKAFLGSIRPVQYNQLPNGFKVAVEHVSHLEFVTIGIWIDAGSRFETRENNGVAHFLEHMNFKGTKRYSKQQIDSLFESLGAHFNAYTSRDRTAYYIKVFNKNVDEVMDLLADILKNGEYCPRFIELERPTILSEMEEVESIIEEVTMDGMHIAAYDAATSGLPLTILGPTENIKKHINRDTIIDYVKTHYTGPRMTMVCCGGLSMEQVNNYAEKYFSDISAESHRPILNATYVGGTATLWNTTMMTAHTHLAFPVCGAAHKDAIALQLMQNLYGMYRREMAHQFQLQGLNMTRPPLDELDSVKFFYTPYEETGLMGFQLVTVPSVQNRDTMARAIDHILDSLQMLMDTPPTVEALEGAKATYKASQMIPLDSTTNSAEDLGRQMVHFGRRIPIIEHFESVDAITPNQFSDTLSKYFDFTKIKPAISTAGPPDALPAFDDFMEVVGRRGRLTEN